MSTERIAELVQIFAQMPIARTFGMRLSYTDEDNAVVDLPYNPDLDHALDGIHGGVYATMLDAAGWFTAAAAHERSRWLLTSELSVHFLAPAERCALRAVGRLIKHGKRQDVIEAHLYDEQGRLVGHATGTFVVLSNTSTARGAPATA